MRLPSRSRFSRYAIVPVVVAVAMLLRWPLWPVLGSELAFLFLWPAAIFCAWFGGLGPGLLATALSALGAAVFLFRLGDFRPADWVGLVVFVALNGVVSLLMDALHKSRWAAALESESLQITLASIGDAVVAADAAGRVTFLNPVAEELTGWRQADAAGRPLTEVFNIVNEYTRAAVADPVAQVLATGKIVGLANHTVLIARGGTERAIEDSAAPIRVPGGPVAGAVLVFRDVTDHRKVEADLRASEERFRQLADAMPQIVFMARPDGHVDYFNRRWYEYTGFPDDGRTGDESWVAVHEPEGLAKVAERWTRALKTGEPYEIEYRLRRADGAWRWHLGRALPVWDANGNVVRWFGTNTDIDDLRRAEEALREADRRKDEFLAMLGHELRNPLAPIVNSVAILRMKANPDPVVDMARETIDRQARHLTRLVDDLLDVGRITQGKIRIRPVPTDLRDAVAHAVETTKPLFDARRQALAVDLPADPVPLSGDPARLTQVFGNLLANSAKFTPSEGRVWIGVSVIGAEGGRGQAEGGEDGSAFPLPPSPFAEVRVRDEGDGIPSEMLPKVFDLFTQVERRGDLDYGGLGIGLSLVKTLVGLHGGTVTAASDGPGKGSEFTVRLPMGSG